MGLTSHFFFALVIILSVAALIACSFGWNRLPNRWLRWAFRSVMLISIQITAVAVVAVALNDSWGFYGSWTELLGRKASVAPIEAVHPGLIDSTLQTRIQAGYHSGHGTILKINISGVHSRVGTFPATVYLPPQYGNRDQAQLQFPVVELYGGFPGNAGNWRHQLGVAEVMDTAISRGYSLPFILVAPTINVALPRDTECANVVNGPQVETYLTDDVRSAIISQFRAQSDSRHWAGMGYSLGGYCALDFALRHPDKYGAAVSISGYSQPAHDRTTGELFGHSTTLRLLSTPSWRLAHLPQPAVSMLLMTSKKDHHSFRQDAAFSRLARTPAEMWTLWTGSGGHNAQFWRSLEPTAFAWLSQRMSGPTSPIPAVNGSAPVRAGAAVPIKARPPRTTALKPGGRRRSAAPAPTTTGQRVLSPLAVDQVRNFVGHRHRPSVLARQIPLETNSARVGYRRDEA